MIRVTDKQGNTINCSGVFETSGDDDSFCALDGPSTAWGYGEEHPFVPAAQDFVPGQPGFEAGFIRLQLNAGWKLA